MVLFSKKLVTVSIRDERYLNMDEYDTLLLNEKIEEILDKAATQISCLDEGLPCVEVSNG